MERVTVAIKGVSALLMHRFPLVQVDGVDKMSPKEQAEHAAYRESETGLLFVPGVALQRGLVNAATFSKGKGRASLQKTVAASVFVSPEIISLGSKDFIVDSRRVVIKATGGAVIRHRPRLDNWACAFTIDFDHLLISEKQLRKVVDDCGALIGLLDFRPERKGPFGRFMVTHWGK